MSEEAQPMVPGEVMASRTDAHVSPSPGRLHRLVRALDVEAVDACGFPAERFLALLAAHRSRGGLPRGGLDGACLEDVGADALPALPAPPGEEAQGALEVGAATFAAGENAVVLLCAGMATRFGGTVKALAELTPGRCFIDAAIERILRMAEVHRAPIPLVVVTSAVSHAAIARHLAVRWPQAAGGGWLRLVRQRVFPRVLADGRLTLASGDLPLLYPPGHGDVLTSLGEHGVPAWLAARGIRRVFTWGIDNPLAGPDERIAAAHVRAGRPVTVEVVRRDAGERGGCILRRDGRIESIEDIRLGPGAAGRQSTLLNTNSMVIDVRVLEHPPELPFHPVEKRLGGRTVLQFERLLGELTHRVDCNILLVPRGGGRPTSWARFAPIKTPEDLRKYRLALRRLAEARAREGRAADADDDDA